MPPRRKIQTNQELQERLDALEAGRKLKIVDLPIDALRRELRKEPQNPTEMLLPHSIGPDLLAGISNEFYIIGTGTIVFTGASIESSIATISHELGEVPGIVLPMTWDAGRHIKTFNYTDTTFQASAQTLQGDKPTETREFTWIAFRDK